MPKFQNNNFTISLHISRKTGRMKLIFCLLIKIKEIFEYRYVWPCFLKLPKLTSLLFLCNILKKKWLMKLVFCKFPTNWYYDFWRRWSSIPKVLKTKSLQYFYNILKMKLEMKLFFCLQIKIKVFYKLISTLWWYYHFW